MTEFKETHGSQISFQGFHWRPWREIAAFSIMLMELSWLVAWHSPLIEPGRGIKPTTIYLIYGLIASVVYWSSKVMLWLQLRVNIHRVVLGSLLIPGYLVVLGCILYPDQPFSVALILKNLWLAFQNTSAFLPNEILLLILYVYLVFRSSTLASSWIGVGVVRRRFNFGMVLLLALSSLSLLLPDIEIVDEILIFLFSSFMAFSSARIASLASVRGGAEQTFDTRAVLSVSLNAILFAGIAYLLGDFTSKNLMEFTVLLLTILSRLFVILIVLLVSPIVLIVSLVVTWLGGNLANIPIIGLLELEVMRIIQVITDFLRTLALLAKELSFQLPDLSWLRPYLRWGLVVAIVSFILSKVSWPDFSSNRQTTVFVENSTSSTRGLLRTWLRDLFKGQLDTFERLTYRGQLGAMRIRRIYTRLTRLCARLGAPRTPTETPLEYLDKLEMLFPEHGEEVTRITDAYNKVRYGGFPETPGEVDAVEDAWRVVRKKGREIVISRRQLEAGKR